MILDGDRLERWLTEYSERIQAEGEATQSPNLKERYRGAWTAIEQIQRALPQFVVPLGGPSPHNVRNTDNQDAKDAAGSNTFGRSKNRAKVYEALKALGSGTPEEIAAKAIEMYPGVYPPYSLARRVTDLAERDLIRKTGDRRRTTAGGMADVWELV